MIAETTQTPAGHNVSLEASVCSDKQSEPFSEYKRQQRLGSSAIRPSMTKKHHMRKSNTLSTVQHTLSHTTGKQTLCADSDPLPAIMQLGGRQFPSAR